MNASNSPSTQWPPVVAGTIGVALMLAIPVVAAIAMTMAPKKQPPRFGIPKGEVPASVSTRPGK